MTTDNLEATLIDDSCFSDIFTMQSQTLNDFDFGLEAASFDNLLELFEEREKMNFDSAFDCINTDNNNVKNRNVSIKRQSNSIIITSPKVRKSTINSTSEMSSKRKGTSLLAKPKKSNARRSLINISDPDLHSFSSCFPRDHDYCLITNDNNLYNKLPDYITLNNISKDRQQSDNFDKIPNYLKGFINFDDNINANNDDFLNKNDGNILIELNEAYIEVSDVFFDCKHSSDDENKMQVYSAEESNSIIDTNKYLNVTNSAQSEDNDDQIDEKDDEDIELPQDIGQSDYSNSNELNNFNNNEIKSRSRSRERRTANNRTRRRRISTRSSVNSSSQSSRSSSQSSCSSCSSCSSYTNRSSDDSKINYNHSNNILRNDNKGQQMTRKRTLQESYCQNSFQTNKLRPNFSNRNHFTSGRNSIKQSINIKRDIEERKIIYVGKIPDGTTKTDIRHWFGRFGAIKEVSIHFRDYGDNYAFVTFYRRCDAYEAIERANEDTRHPKFDLSFGGRRQFCKTRYEDLDYTEDTSYTSEQLDFDALLRTTQAKLNR